MIKDRIGRMQTGFSRRSKDTALYIRWEPQHSPYTIELKLDLAAKIAEDTRLAKEAAGMEIGGVLLGTLPTNDRPTLRIDEVEMIPRRSADGPVFLVGPKEYERFVAATSKPFQDGRVALGLFRSHTRSGPLRPALADRTLIAEMFHSGVCALLLVEAVGCTASLFVGHNQSIPDQPAMDPFQLNAEELAALPEADASGKAKDGVARSRKASYAAAAILAGTIAAAAYAWSGVSAPLLSSPAADDPHLTVSGSDVLKISWNHRAHLIQDATQAKLLLVDGENAREITLGRDELRSGALEYERRNRTVQIMLVLTMPGEFSVTQSVAWRAKT
jgi:hypothetical protein